RVSAFLARLMHHTEAAAGPFPWQEASHRRRRLRIKSLGPPESQHHALEFAAAGAGSQPMDSLAPGKCWNGSRGPAKIAAQAVPFSVGGDSTMHRHRFLVQRRSYTPFHVALAAAILFAGLAPALQAGTLEQWLRTEKSTATKRLLANVQSNGAVMASPQNA